MAISPHIQICLATVQAGSVHFEEVGLIVDLRDLDQGDAPHSADDLQGALEINDEVSRLARLGAEAQDCLLEMSAALSAAILQIEKMSPSVPDEDGSIAKALKGAVAAQLRAETLIDKEEFPSCAETARLSVPMQRSSPSRPS